MITDSSSPFEAQVARTLERAALAPPPELAVLVRRALDSGRRPAPTAAAPAGRRWAPWPAAVAVAAVVLLGAGAALRMGPFTAAPSSVPPGAPSTQVVTARMLAAFQENGDRVVHMHQTGTGGNVAGTVDIWSSSTDPHAGDEVRTRTVAGNGTAISRDTEVIFTQPADASITTVTGERIAVDYASRTWADVKGVPLTPRVAGPTPDTIRAYIAAGQYRVVGRVELDGRPAIELVRTYTGGKDRDQRLWVDPGTYLPLRAVITQADARAQADYEFLPPTDANLANLRPVIPPGFTQTPTLPFK
jgi:hypothetical protein